MTAPFTGSDTSQPARPGGLVGVWAHPDDEAFSMGGSMARYAAAGRYVALVCATRGEVGEIADPALATSETLGRVREGELRAAAAALGVHDVSFLDYVDGQVAQANPEEIVGRIVRQLRRLRPAVLVTFAANGMYGHPDHMAVHRFTLAAIAAAPDPARYPDQLTGGIEPHRVAKVYFSAPPRERMLAMREQMRASGQGDFTPGGNAATIPFEEMATPEADITTRIQLTDAELDAKLRAMREHATQMPPGNPFNAADREQLRMFMGWETFQLLPPPYSARAFPTPEDDLFAGLA